ncbi:formate dehydrogenase accessory sulfurtransferase FdhD [Labrys okinawensis]|uniref:Sulfur carrier protein FdhD n=1 Tax=Labrys okinawensis TaxID=346911 RepID=A0A2S9QAI8_9HYPH|nr:formate dehydrogenase accessory sulfurtransferase FdhD [Labrys okinawensis]PRH86359.1 formate dehydrogenase accessory sulfurtransferase FdhD [Labrys okinawensis]
MTRQPPPVRTISRLAWRDGVLTPGERTIPEETAVSLVYDGGSHAVMMASPVDLEDFAYGFSLTEGIVASLDDVTEFERVDYEEGVELRLWLRGDRGAALAARRRMLAGPTGCGLCGIDSLTEAVRKPQPVIGDLKLSPADIEAALASLAPAQTLNHQTRAVHAAAFWTKADGLVALREDVGRHNALDKLAGALARHRSADILSASSQPAGAAEPRADETSAQPETLAGIVVLTSRISVEMVQKSAMMGAPIVAAVSAPTALAIRTADEAGITLIGVARSDGFEIFTHPHRIVPEKLAHVA